MIRVRYNFTTSRYDISLGSLAYELQDGKITFALDDDEALGLVDQLKRSGLVIEDEGSYNKGLLAATVKHLEDMRRLTMLENEKGEL